MGKCRESHLCLRLGRETVVSPNWEWRWILCFSLQKCRPPSHQHQTLLWIHTLLLPPLSSSCYRPPSLPAMTPRIRPPRCCPSSGLSRTPQKTDDTWVTPGADAWRTFSKAPPASLSWGWSPVVRWLWSMTCTVKCCAPTASWTIPCLPWIPPTWHWRGSPGWTVWTGWTSQSEKWGERKPPRWPHSAPRRLLVSFPRTSWTLMTCRYTGTPASSLQRPGHKQLHTRTESCHWLLRLQYLIRALRLCLLTHCFIESSSTLTFYLFYLHAVILIFEQTLIRQVLRLLLPSSTTV